MDNRYSTTISAERKRGAHLGAENRGAIQQLDKLGYSERAIGREIGCSQSTVGYVRKLSTPTESSPQRLFAYPLDGHKSA